MGFIAEAMAAYAQPLLDETDGSLEQMDRALALAQICWNLAVLPEDEREEAIGKLRPGIVEMDDEEFDEFRRSVLVPMILRHEEMFPQMHVDGPMGPLVEEFEVKDRPTTRVRTGKYPGTGRNAPCPCGSGKKYKKCHGR